jgi:Bacterial conjugation TrbI-like protein
VALRIKTDAKRPASASPPNLLDQLGDKEMKRLLNIVSIAVFSAVIFSMGASDVAAQKKPVLRKKAAVKRPVVPSVPVYTVDTGTIIRARMNSTLTSKSAAVGNTFTSTVTEPVYASNGAVVIPTGATLTGRVTSVKKAAKSGEPGQIDVAFVSVRLPNGAVRSINGSLTDLESGKTKSDNEGGVGGSKMKNRKIVFIGGGAAGGAVLGAMVGGGKATAIGAIIGAGAGFLGEKLLKGPEAEVKSGTEFSVYLNQAIRMPKFAEVNP